MISTGIEGLFGDALDAQADAPSPLRVVDPPTAAHG